MHTYVFVRRDGGKGRRVNPPRVSSAQGVRFHVHGGVRALVPMLSADIPRDRPRARVRGHDIIIAEPGVFPRRALGKWYLGGRLGPRGVGDIRLISAKEEVLWR